jgi:hypothetical protein
MEDAGAPSAAASASASASAEAGPGPALDDTPALKPESVPALLRGLAAELPGLVSDRIQLLSLELHRAGLAMAQIVALVVVIAVLLVTAWLALWAGVAVALFGLGLHMGWVVLIVVGANLGAAGWALQRVQRLAPLLALPATVRRMTIGKPEAAGQGGAAAPAGPQQFP